MIGPILNPRTLTNCMRDYTSPLHRVKPRNQAQPFLFDARPASLQVKGQAIHRHVVHARPLPGSFWTLKKWVFSSGAHRHVCGSCSSGQRFACGFLQIPPHGGHPCRPANSSHCRACRGLSPPSQRALPGAHRKKGGKASAFPPFGSSGKPERFDYLTSVSNSVSSEANNSMSTAN